jgi:hypothetical protein
MLLENAAAVPSSQLSNSIADSSEVSNTRGSRIGNDLALARPVSQVVAERTCSDSSHGKNVS